MLRPSFIVLLGITIIFLSGCLPYEEERITDINLDLNNPKLQRLYTLQDERQVDSLFAYFRHKDPTYRYAAALAFGSIKNEKAIDSLKVLLKDEVQKVRAAAAFAIGQIGEESAANDLIGAFNQKDTAKIEVEANHAILEAVGKIASIDFLKALSTIKTYDTKDTLLLSGQAWGIYRYALRDKTLPEGTDRMIELVTNGAYPLEVRLIAANYLYRAKDIRIDSLKVPSLVETIEKEEDVRIRMALAIGLGKTKREKALITLLNLYEKERDYRVKCNIIRAFGNFDYGRVQATILKGLQDGNHHVVNTAAQFFIDFGIGQDATFYWRTAKDTLPWQAKTLMYMAANKYLPTYYSNYKGAINYELRNLFYEYDSPYAKAATLTAMREHGWNYRYIHQLGFSDESPVVRTASLEALKYIVQDKEFKKKLGLGYRRATREIGEHFIAAIQTGDPAMMAIAAEGLRVKERKFDFFLDSLQVLDRALTKLEMPKEIETYNEIKKTIDFYKGVSNTPIKQAQYNHPIDWSIIESLNPSTRAKIKTRWGVITLELLPEYAPGTVASFVHLAKTGFYDGKNFHRVIPNFVIQTGYTRGDGWGSTDFTIRSEFSPLHYDDEGYVGMASLGTDTESSQFFITHSPAPHLDGKYTIFAKVTNGMEVVHKVKLGDVMEKVSIIN